MHLVIWVAKINRVAKIMAHRPNGASRQLQPSRQCQRCCIYMKDIIYDYMLALAAVLAYLQSIWWSVLLFWLLSLPNSWCMRWPPAKSGGHQRLQRATGVHIGLSFSPASLCQRVPPIRGAPMAPTTARTTRVRRVWLVCVVVGVGHSP